LTGTGRAEGRVAVEESAGEECSEGGRDGRARAVADGMRTSDSRLGAMYRQ
jgi:hypothetical protein